MANTSILTPVSIYGINANATGGAAGTTYGFPPAHTFVRPAPASTTFNGVTVNSILQLLPTAPNHVSNQPQYYSDRTVAQVVTLMNTTS